MTSFTWPVFVSYQLLCVIQVLSSRPTGKHLDVISQNFSRRNPGCPSMDMTNTIEVCHFRHIFISLPAKHGKESRISQSSRATSYDSPITWTWLIVRLF